jgi:hypothetical protein
MLGICDLNIKPELVGRRSRPTNSGKSGNVEANELPLHFQI